MDFKNGCVILMGDMNFCMEPRVNSTSRVQGTNNAQLKMIRQKLHVCQMVDIWRIKNPKTQDFTFYSPVHGTYSRIDYILVDHRLLDMIVESSIELFTLSDHAPVRMKMIVSKNQRQPFAWRLNEDLLRDEVGSNIVEKELEHYFATNDTEEILGSTLWEAHKAYIRGILIDVGARKKKREQGKLKI